MAANLALGISPNHKPTFFICIVVVSLSHSVNSVDGTHTTFIDAPSHFLNALTFHASPTACKGKEDRSE